MIQSIKNNLCKLRIKSILLISLLCLGCSSKDQPPPTRDFVATIAPAAMILQELSGTEVETLVPSGASEHTYEPTPADAMRTTNAIALVYISDNLDAWASHLEAKQRIALFDLLPGEFKLPIPELNHGDHDHGHDHGDHDPHFWMDPLSVKALLGPLTSKLSGLNPQNAAQYTASAKEFSESLIALDAELRETLAPLKGKKVILHHPSLRYFLKRYGLEVAGYIESSPGKEPSPQQIAQLLDTIKTQGVALICTEPQLSPRAAQALAESAGIPVVEVDILGGRKGLETYADLLRYNAAQLRKALP